METFLESLTGLVAVVLSLGIPTIVVLLVFLRKIKRDRQQKEIRQLIIENHTDAETAKLLIDEPKKEKEPSKLGAINLENFRAACILLGIGLGAFINWGIESIGLNLSNIYFWLIIAFGIGVGLLCAFLVEIYLYKKYGKDRPSELTNEQ